MSRGGRGGFGGPRNMAGTMSGVALPFDVDPDLESEIRKHHNGNTTEEAKKAEEAAGQDVYPPYPGGVPRAPPVTAREKRLVQIYREMQAEKHASPAYTGPPGSLKALCNKRTAADFNAFEDQQTYGKKYEKKPFRLADPKKRKWQAPHLFPKDLWETIGYNPDANEDEQAPRKKIVLNSKATLDKLARFDEDAEAGGAKDDDDDEHVNAEEDADAEAEAPKDDDFSEDDDDDGNDYNAEQYFDDGEDDHEEGGDEGGGGEDW
ncbi:DNA-directed RNA polymerase III subunit C31 [Teratosphaeriaceae sp. CCFEE 6253]|nr:DNA-directed RNA polymerase III subunit C31 [Teratosphaeriaceae sp. CCFEE 6253]